MQELKKDVEQLLVSLILDNQIHGHIDQVNQLLELGDRSVSSMFPLKQCCACSVIYAFAHAFFPSRSRGQRTYTALDKWSQQLRSLHHTVVNKIG